mmetsp:Transcript_52626/g.102922  ORF Transcript_52626/g.102922 Transcript_52626/m.102922 type:complete len:90 (+) Transcript_52626:69-338(+)
MPACLAVLVAQKGKEKEDRRTQECKNRTLPQKILFSLSKRKSAYEERRESELYDPRKNTRKKNYMQTKKEKKEGNNEKKDQTKERVFAS